MLRHAESNVTKGALFYSQNENMPTFYNSVVWGFMSETCEWLRDSDDDDADSMRNLYLMHNSFIMTHSGYFRFWKKWRMCIDTALNIKINFQWCCLKINRIMSRLTISLLFKIIIWCVNRSQWTGRNRTILRQATFDFLSSLPLDLLWSVNKRLNDISLNQNVRLGRTMDEYWTYHISLW